MKTIVSIDDQNRFGELLENAQRKQILADFMDFFARSEALISLAAKGLNDTDIETLVNELR